MDLYDGVWDIDQFYNDDMNYDDDALHTSYYATGYPINFPDVSDRADEGIYSEDYSDPPDQGAGPVRKLLKIAP